QVPAGLPGLTLPRASFAQWMALIPGALALVALTASEGLLLARNYAQTYNYVVDSDQEMFAYGVANVAAGFTGALPVGTSSSRSAAMDDAGMRSQWPTVVAAIVVALVLLFFTDLLALLPSAVLAGVVANAVLKLIDIAGLRELYAMRRSEFWIAIVCLLGVLVLGTLAGLTVAFLLTTIAVVGRAARPQTGILTEHSDGTGFRIADGMDEAVTAPGLIIYRFGGPLFFANATFFREQVEQWAARLSDGDWFTLDAQAVNDIDVTGAEAFRGVLDYLHSRQVTFAMSGAYAPIPELLARYDLAERIGEDRLYVNNREALVAFYGETGRPVPDPFAAWIKTNPGTAVSVDREVGID
ncbi:MAG: STAS domain-containing protein, partial [Anaerolineae bacterium]|nr:STAS domain-containing protein [Anaerolineae bacterium]